MPSHDTQSEPAETPVDLGLRCLECDYNLTGLTEGRCPECGWTIDLDLLEMVGRQEPPLARQGLLAILSGTVAAASLAMAPILITLLGKLTPIGIAYTAATILAGGLHLYWAIRNLASLTDHPKPSPRFIPMASFAFGLAQIFMAMRIMSELPLGPSPGIIGTLVLLIFIGAPGWTLVFTTLINAPGRKGQTERLRRMHDRYLQSGDDPGAAFRVDASGQFSPNDVHIEWRDDHRKTDAALEAQIESEWQAAQADADMNNRILFNGKLVRLIGAAHDARRVAIILGPTTYREFVGTNLAIHHEQYTHEQFDPKMANPVGTSALIITSDHRLLLGLRTQRVAYHPGFAHTFGGALEEADIGQDNHCDVFDSIRRELREELALTDADIRDIKLTAIVRDFAIQQPELIFEIETTLTSREVISRFATLDCPEHERVLACDDQPEAILLFIQSAGQPPATPHTPSDSAATEPSHPRHVPSPARRTPPRAGRITPVASAALLLHGRRHFGRDWYDSACLLLYGDIPPEHHPAYAQSTTGGAGPATPMP